MSLSASGIARTAESRSRFGVEYYDICHTRLTVIGHVAKEKRVPRGTMGWLMEPRNAAMWCLESKLGLEIDQKWWKSYLGTDIRGTPALLLCRNHTCDGRVRKDVGCTQGFVGQNPIMV